ncbi:LLM class flavin-dependent oxidoreductase [Corynebacterium pyruviciproducens]
MTHNGDIKKFGFLSFGHYAIGHQRGITAADSLKQSLDIAQAADNLGVNGAYFRVHHFAPQAASPIPIMSAIAGSTKHIEVGTGVIDMRYENPYYLAEEAAALDLLSDGRVALGVSRGSPEPAKDGWRAFGYDAEQKKRLRHGSPQVPRAALRRPRRGRRRGRYPGAPVPADVPARHAAAHLPLLPRPRPADLVGLRHQRHRRAGRQGRRQPHELHACQRGRRLLARRYSGRADPPVP